MAVLWRVCVVVAAASPIIAVSLVVVAFLVVSGPSRFTAVVWVAVATSAAVMRTVIASCRAMVAVVVSVGKVPLTLVSTPVVTTEMRCSVTVATFAALVVTSAMVAIIRNGLRLRSPHWTHACQVAHSFHRIDIALDRSGSSGWPPRCIHHSVPVQWLTRLGRISLRVIASSQDLCHPFLVLVMLRLKSLTKMFS